MTTSSRPWASMTDDEARDALRQAMAVYNVVRWLLVSWSVDVPLSTDD